MSENIDILELIERRLNALEIRDNSMNDKDRIDELNKLKMKIGEGSE